VVLVTSCLACVNTVEAAAHPRKLRCDGYPCLHLLAINTIFSTACQHSLDSQGSRPLGARVE
jgi:hypothetical protein